MADFFRTGAVTGWPTIVSVRRKWWNKPRDSSNLIVFAVKNEHFYPQWSRLMSKAKTLGRRYRLDLL